MTRIRVPFRDGSRARVRRRWDRLRSRAMGQGRSGGTVRVRLTALYGGLFLVSGGILLAFTYALVAHRLPSGAVFVDRSVKQPHSAIRLLLNGQGVRVTGQGVTVGGNIMSLPVPLKGVGIPPPNAILGQVRDLADTTRASSLHQLLVDSGLALAVMAVASSGLGWLMAGRAMRPLRAMTGAAQRISEHNLHERLPETGPRDELRDLAATFNALLGRLESAFDSQRRFVANASHELRTPLTLERALLEVALADPHADEESLRATCARVLEIGAGQEALIDALITLARSQRGLEQRERLDLTAIVGDTIEAAAPRAEARSIEVHADLAPAAVSGDHRLVERLVANLLDNALGHNYPGGWVRVVVSTDHGSTRLRVSNSGPVVTAGDVTRLLQPFQRGGVERVANGNGLGLGLSIVEAIASAHGARLDISARPEGGLDVEVAFSALPAAPGAVVASDGRETATDDASVWTSTGPPSGS